MNVEPYSPADVADVVAKTIDNAVFTVVNRQLSNQGCHNGYVPIFQDQVLEELRQPRYAYLHGVSDERLLGFTAAYEAKGWTVTYDATGANGRYAPYWRFKSPDTA